LIFRDIGILDNNGIIENRGLFWMGGDSKFINRATATINNEQSFFISPTDIFGNPGQTVHVNNGEMINNGNMLIGNFSNSGTILDNCKNIRIEGSFSGNPVIVPDSIDTPCSLSWDGEAGDGLWSNPINWIDNTLPTGSDFIVIDSNTSVDSTVHLDIAFTLTTGSMLINLGDSLIVDSTGKFVNNSPDTIHNLGTLVVNGELVNNEDGTIENSGTISNNGSITNTGTITSNGIIENNLDGTILNQFIILPDRIIRGTIGITDGTVNNDGTITNLDTITNGGIITNNNVILNHFKITNNENGIIINNKNIKQFRNTDVTFVRLELTNFGTIVNNDSIDFNGIITNHGTIENFDTISSKGCFDLGLCTNPSFINHGTIENHGTYNQDELKEKECRESPIVLESQDGNILVIDRVRCFAIDNVNFWPSEFENHGTFTNTGHLNIGDGKFSNPGTIVNEGEINNTSYMRMFGGTIDNNGGTITNSAYMLLTKLDTPHGREKGTINNNGGTINNDGTIDNFLPWSGNCFDDEEGAFNIVTVCRNQSQGDFSKFWPGSKININNGDINNFGVINNHIDSFIGHIGNTIINDGVINNDGNVENEGDFINNCDGVIQGEAVIDDVFDNCDYTPPGFASIIPVVEEATSVDGAIVSYELPEIIDNKDPNPTIECTPESGSQFPIGISEITCTASDSFDNTSVISLLVIVIDSPPILELPEDIEVDATSAEGAEVFFDVSATDLIDGPVTPICEPESGSLFPVGETTVTCTATDLADNTSEGTFTVTVDATPPTTCTLPEVLINGECVDPTPTDPTSLEHYLGYKVKEPKDADKFEKFTVTLSDQFETATYTVEKPDRLFTPVEKNGEEIIDFISHYVGYKIKIPKGDDKFEKIEGVSVTDQFGQLTIDIKKPKLLLVPSAKNHTDIPDTLNPVTVNHFKCYDVKESKDTSKFEKLIVTVNDPNFEITQDFEVKKPKMLCIPVDKNGEGLVAEENNLTCYDVKKLKDDPKFEKRNVFTNNQFGPEELKVTHSLQLRHLHLLLPQLLE